MKLSQILRAFEAHNVKLDVKSPDKVFHGGFNKVKQQFDFRFHKEGSWYSGSFDVVWSASHTFEYSQKTDATSSDGMRALYKEVVRIITHNNEDPTVWEIYCGGRHNGDRLDQFVSDNFPI